MGEDVDKAIKRAREVLEEISRDKRERYLAELREKYLSNQKRIEKEGYNNGLKDGRSQGQKEEKEKIAQNLLKLNMPIEQIKEVTGLTKEEIEKLK